MINTSSINSFCEKDVNLKNFTTWKIGGKADYLLKPRNLVELKLSLEFVSKHNLNFFLLGNGSNILFDDNGVRGVVIKLSGDFEQIHINDNRVKAGAGVWAPYLCRKLGDLGLSGIEHIVGIPASMGGLTYMNGGSQRKNVSSHIIQVEVMDFNGKLKTYNNKECDFSYRTSIFKKNKNVIITSVKFQLENSNIQEVKEKMLKILTDRSKKFPRKIPNCGSVFQSTGEVYDKYGPPGKIIEELGLKGMKFNSVRVSDVHSNFITHDGNGKSSDVIHLINYIKKEIINKTGYKLNVEPIYINPIGKVEKL